MSLAKEGGASPVARGRVLRVLGRACVRWGAGWVGWQPGLGEHGFQSGTWWGGAVALISALGRRCRRNWGGQSLGGQLWS